MKKLLQNLALFSCLFLLCCGNKANAQPYQSIFGDSITQFNVFVPCMDVKAAFDEYDPELGERYTQAVFFKRGNDTIINGETYQIGKIPDSGKIVVKK